MQLNIGIIYAIGASMLYATYMLVTKDILRRVGTIPFMFYSMLSACVFLLILCLALGNELIHFNLKTWGSSILFTVKNSCSDDSNEVSILKKDSGFGLATVMKRLELLYKGNYELVTEEKNGYYTVMLQLKSK